MKKDFHVGDEIALDLDYLLIVKSGEVEGLTINQKEKEKTAIITHITNAKKYPYKLNQSLGGTSRFAKDEIIKVQK